MFTHMIYVKKELYNAHGNSYELIIYQVQESEEYRIYISKNGFGVGDIFTANQEVASDFKSSTGVNLIEELISIAKKDIDRNEFGLY